MARRVSARRDHDDRESGSTTGGGHDSLVGRMRDVDKRLPGNEEKQKEDGLFEYHLQLCRDSAHRDDITFWASVFIILFIHCTMREREYH